MPETYRTVSPFISATVPVLQTRKLRPREVKSVIQSHTASKCQSQAAGGQAGQTSQLVFLKPDIKRKGVAYHVTPGDVDSDLDGLVQNSILSMVTLEAGLVLILSPGLRCHLGTCSMGSEVSNSKQGSWAHPRAAANLWRWPEIGQALE